MLDLEIEDKGQTLSAGMRLLFSILRAMLRKSKILLLDEPTEAVDPETANAI